MRESISTSPKAIQLYQMIKRVDPLVGPAETQTFMHSTNEHLDGKTPVDCIRAGQMDVVDAAVRCLAIEKGLFAEPYLPPGKD